MNLDGIIVCCSVALRRRRRRRFPETVPNCNNTGFTNNAAAIPINAAPANGIKCDFDKCYDKETHLIHVLFIQPSLQNFTNNREGKKQNKALNLAKERCLTNYMHFLWPDVTI